MNDAKHRRDQCMVCAKPPEFEILWAEGFAHAWFCKEHLKEFVKKSAENCLKNGYSNLNCELNAIKKVNDSEAAKHWKENKNPNVLDDVLHEIRSKINFGLHDKSKSKEGEIKSIGLRDAEEEELSKRSCDDCHLEICSEECFNAHPGSMIALTKLLRSQGVEASIIDESRTEELAPVNSSGVELGEEITLAQIRPYFKSFYINRPYVYLVGGLCNHGKTKGDIDIFIRKVLRDVPLEFRITRMFPRELQNRIHFIYPESDRDDHLGVYTNHIPIFNEKIEIISAPELVLMSKKCTKIELFKFCPLLKPAHGRHKGEEYEVEKLIEIVNAQPEWYEHGIYVQKKFDGVHVRCDVQRNYESGFDVKIWTEEGNDITQKLPTLRAELEKMSGGHKKVVVGELEYWESEKHQSRQQTTAIIHTKEVHKDEGKVVLNVFDVLYWNGDIHKEPYKERVKFLAEIKETKQIRRAHYRLVNTPTELKKAVEYFAGQPGSEGAYLKRADFEYELDGKSLLNIKYKSTFSIDAKVIKIQKIKDANAYNYLCVIGADVPCGKTYNTSIKVEEGEIVKVEFVNLSRYTDPKTKKTFYNWWSPRVIMAREDKKKPDNTETADKLVEASHGTVAEKSWPKRYIDSLNEDTNPYLTYPDEAKTYKGMVHCHGRGKSVHLDFRCQMSDDYATGWTLYIPKGLSKVPEDFAEFKRLVDAEIMPIVKQKVEDPRQKFNCGKKAPEPMEWLSYEGMVKPGGIGATKNEPGFFYIIDKFSVEFGAQKPHFHEYFCDGNIFDGRVVFTLLENKKEWKKTDEGLMTWMASVAEKAPYVLGNRAKNKKWIPPYAFSALPRKLRNKVPKDLRYWEHKNLRERLELRDELVQQLKKRLLKLDALGPARFRFIKQTWKGQKVIRGGPSRVVYYFLIFQRSAGKETFCLAMENGMAKQAATSGIEVPKLADALKTVEEGEVPTESILNPTKATPSKIEILDEGPASIISVSAFKRYRLDGKKLKGIWIAFKRDEKSKMWILKKSDLPEPEKRT